MRAYPFARFYIIDSKGDPADFSDFGNVVESDEAPTPLLQPGTIVWRPGVDDREQYGLFLERILKAKRPAVVYIDELSSLGGNSGKSYPAGYSRIQKQGRGLNIAVITTTQEAAYIPRTVLGMSTHIVRFRLQNQYDAQQIDKFLRLDVKTNNEPQHGYGFYYRRVATQDPATYFSDRSLFFTGG